MSETTDVTKASQESLKYTIAQLGYSGLRVNNGIISEEIKRELQFPQSILTYKQMGYDSTVASALNYYEHMMLKSDMKVKPHPEATEPYDSFVALVEDFE